MNDDAKLMLKADELFKTIDTDGNKVIDLNELSQAMTQMGVMLSVKGDTDRRRRLPRPTSPRLSVASRSPTTAYVPLPPSYLRGGDDDGDSRCGRRRVIGLGLEPPTPDIATWPLSPDSDLPTTLAILTLHHHPTATCRNIDLQEFNDLLRSEVAIHKGAKSSMCVVS